MKLQQLFLALLAISFRLAVVDSVSQAPAPAPAPVPAPAAPVQPVAMCDITYTKIGCFKHDPQQPRPVFLSTDRDNNSLLFSGKKIDWVNWASYLPDLVCRCAKKAEEKKYRYFSIQNYGECLAVNDNFNRSGEAGDCVDTKRNFPCVTGSSAECAGMANENYVYSIPKQAEPSVQSQCPVSFSKVGCFKDKLLSPERPLPKLLFTDRDPQAKAGLYSNVRINWGNWNAYLGNITCRCAMTAKQYGYPYFGIQFYGECWSGPYGTTYDKDGQSKDCISTAFEQCELSSRDKCVGKAEANFVYLI